MKRDMDLVRSILLHCADSRIEIVPLKSFEALADPKVVVAHIRLLRDANLVSAEYRTSRLAPGNQTLLGWRLTWQGNEFLESVRDPEIWRKTKSGAEKVGAWSIKLLSEIAAGYVRQKAIALGLPVTM